MNDSNTNMLKIGLTGGIGSGKSTVTTLFRKLGIPIIDMDVLAREVVMPGQPALKEIKECFGDQVFNKNGQLNRRELRNIIFSDPDKRTKLESIIHPQIRQRVKTQLKELTTPYCIIVIPLLFETHQQDNIDRILVVDTHLDDQIQRTMQRDKISENAVRDIITTQVSRQTRLDGANDIINNTDETNKLEDQVDHLHQHYLELSQDYH